MSELNDAAKPLEDGQGQQATTTRRAAAYASNANRADEDQGTGPANVVLLTSKGPLAAIVTNFIARDFRDLIVIREPAETKSQILRRRMRLLGLFKTTGQVAGGLVTRIVSKLSNARISEICETHNLDRCVNSSITVHHVSSVNSEEARGLLAALQPSVVAVYGTRLIGRQTLQSIPAPFINYHAGINPKYRGQHPAYWALASGYPGLAGVTIHLVDEGVDTGAVLYQKPVQFSPSDNIATYQYAQAAAALPLLARAVEDALFDRIIPITVDLPSQVWFPPTVWQYLWNGLFNRVW